MKYYLMIVASAILMLCACRGEKTETAETVSVDSVPDSLATDSLGADTAEPPVAADGLFDDFMYNFMRNRKFQKKRIKFPLENLVDGKNKPIAEGAWKFDPVYVREEVYTMLFDDEKSVTSEKDTSVHHVIVEWVYLDRGRVKLTATSLSFTSAFQPTPTSRWRISPTHLSSRRMTPAISKPSMGCSTWRSGPTSSPICPPDASRISTTDSGIQTTGSVCWSLQAPRRE